MSPVFNTCVKCGAKVKIRSPRKEDFKRMLETGSAICNQCDPRSGWRRVDEE